MKKLERVLFLMEVLPQVRNSSRIFLPNDRYVKEIPNVINHSLKVFPAPLVLPALKVIISLIVHPAIKSPSAQEYSQL